MLFFYFIYLIIALMTLIYLINRLVGRKKDSSIEFFIAALRNENNGYYEEAVITYEKALAKAKKSRFNNMLKTRIVEKIKVLHTIIAYQNDYEFNKKRV